MRWTIKALTWIIVILWIITLILPVSVAFSLMRLAEGRNLGFQEPTFTFYNGNISLVMPICINNTGFYDLSEVNVKIMIGKANTGIATMSKSLPDIPAGQMVNTSCSFTANLKEIFQKDRTLLTEDANLDVNAALHFRIAYAIAFNLTHNFSTQWGAPFHNLTVYGVDYNDTAHILSFFISFINHAFFSLNGPLAIELRNPYNEIVGIGLLNLAVPSGETFREFVDVAVDFSKMTDRVFISLFFADSKIFEEEWVLP